MNGAGKLVAADVAAVIAIPGELKQIFLAAARKYVAHPARAFVHVVLAIIKLPFPIALVGQVRSHLVFADNLKLRSGNDEIVKG